MQHHRDMLVDDPATARLLHGLALVGIALAGWMLTHHAPRRLIELELVAPALLLLLVGQAVWAMGRAARASQPMAPLIAIVGSDGSGKSTLSADLIATLADERAIAGCYLGLGTGEIGNRIKRWPLVGPALERRLVRKAGEARDPAKRIPGLATALVLFGLSLVRVRRFRRMLALRRRGVTVITDRYPQVEVMGFYDGPGLSAARAGNAAVAWLARRERAMYEWMASFRPDIVIRLNVDAATALARKPDHRPDLIARKVAATAGLRFGGARMVDVDATAAYDAVRETTLSNIRYVLSHAPSAARPTTEAPVPAAICMP